MKEMFYPRLRETVHETTLPNGLRIKAIYRPEFEKFYAVIMVNCGSVDNIYCRNGETVRMPEGIAHYLEHKKFDLPEGSADQLFAALGASSNAYTSYDFTAYYFQTTDHRAEALQVLLRMVLTPCFTQESVQKEQGIIAQEIKMAADDPYDRLNELHMEAAFPGNPLAAPILGTEQSISRITPELLQRWYLDFYRPDNMVLCVEGALAPEEVAAIASAVPAPERTGEVESLFDDTPAAPPLIGTRIFRRDVSMPTFKLSFPVPDQAPENQRFEIAASLALELLAGDSAECYRRLYESGLVDSGFGWDLVRYRRKTLFSFSGDSSDPEAVCASICTAAEDLRNHGIPSEDLTRLKRSMLGRELRDLDSFSVNCIRLAESTICGQDYYRFPEIIEEITAAEILDLLRFIVREQATLTIIAPKEESQ